MRSFLRFFRLLSLVLWIGGIAFFAFVVAPVAFGNLPSAHEAGLVVRGSLLVLHWIGISSAIVFLAATALLKSRRIQLALAAAMLGITLVSQFYVLPAMEKDRAGGAIETLDISDSRRVDFERLHVLSERLEGAVLLLGLGLLGLIATEA